MSDSAVAVRTTCRVCDNAKLDPIISLGDLFVSDFVDGASAADTKAPLELVLCNEATGGCGLLQLRHTVSHESMYRNYWYRSGMNQTMTDELQGIARTIESLVSLAPGDRVIDIGANDGTLLRSYREAGLVRVGFEPARNLGKYNSVGTSKIVNDFFNYEAWRAAYGEERAKAITAIAMFYDIEAPNTFIADVSKCLAPDGVFIIQMSYLPLMLSQNAFDNICHEHVEYYSLLSLENLLKRHDLEVFDVALNDVNGGSFRIYMRHSGATGITIPDGAALRVEKLRAQEQELGLGSLQVYKDFVARVDGIKEKVVGFIRGEAAKDKKTYVYGASTKGNTLLQFFGLDHALIPAAAERNPDKWGKKTVGTLIPIISEEQARAEHPDYFLILPWHFLAEFKRREADYLHSGGGFIVPLPEFSLVTKTDL